MYRRKIAIFGIILSAFLVACASEPQMLEQMTIPFSGQSVMGDVKGDPYRYFRYQNEGAAKADVARVSADGKKIDDKRMPWNGPVHIYYLNERIVIYVGENQETLQTIEQVFGRQVAGDEG